MLDLLLDDIRKTESDYEYEVEHVATDDPDPLRKRQ
jgi:hypothetical protein